MESLTYLGAKYTSSTSTFDPQDWASYIINNSDLEIILYAGNENCESKALLGLNKFNPFFVVEN